VSWNAHRQTQEDITSKNREKQTANNALSTAKTKVITNKDLTKD